MEQKIDGWGGSLCLQTLVLLVFASVLRDGCPQSVCPDIWADGLSGQKCCDHTPTVFAGIRVHARLASRSMTNKELLILNASFGEGA